jgi:hypothetical protein
MKTKYIKLINLIYYVITIEEFKEIQRNIRHYN